jgi:hypothetical protein
MDRSSMCMLTQQLLSRDWIRRKPNSSTQHPYGHFSKPSSATYVGYVVVFLSLMWRAHRQGRLCLFPLRHVHIYTFLQRESMLYILRNFTIPGTPWEGDGSTSQIRPSIYRGDMDFSPLLLIRIDMIDNLLQCLAASAGWSLQIDSPFSSTVASPLNWAPRSNARSLSRRTLFPFPILITRIISPTTERLHSDRN